MRRIMETVESSMTAESGKGQPQLWVVLSTLLMPCPVCAGECQCGRSDEAIRPAAGESVSVLKAQPAAVALAMREPRIAEARSGNERWRQGSPATVAAGVRVANISGQ